MMKINHFCHQIYCPLRAWSSKRWKYIFGWCSCAERMLRVRHRKSFTVCNVHIISTTSSMELFFNLKFGRTKIMKHGTKIKNFGLNENLTGYAYFSWSGVVIYWIEIVWERETPMFWYFEIELKVISDPRGRLIACTDRYLVAYGSWKKIVNLNNSVFTSFSLQAKNQFIVSRLNQKVKRFTIHSFVVDMNSNNTLRY